MPDLQELFDQSASAMRAAGYWGTRTARLMIGVPDYEAYVAHRRANHPDQPIMTYVEFFRERQQARYAIGKGRFRGCC
jgi:uncharacterized short protein YbdD (DUF466 family)